MPSRYPNAQLTLLTGSSDGLLRAVQLFPTKMLGVVADHGEFPIERIAVDMRGEGNWVGSVGHEEVLKLTDLREVFEDEDGEGSDEEEEGEEKEGTSGEDVEAGSGEDEDEGEGNEPAAGPPAKEDADQAASDEDAEEGKGESSDEEVDPEPRKRKRKKEKDPLLATKRKKGRNEVEAEPAFFADL